MSYQKLLVIGAGIGQIPIIEKAKKRGIHTSVVTLPGKQPGIELADDVFYCDIYDRDAIVEWAKTHGITAVTSDQNDLMNPTVAYVAEKLGLPGNTFNQVMSYCDKNTFRDNCDYLKIPSPKHISVDNEDFDVSIIDMKYPLVVKPSDSQSSVGVTRVDNINDFHDALLSALNHSKTHKAIVEEFFEGREIVCEGFIENGTYRLLGFADRKYFNLNNLMIPSQTVFPSIVSKSLLNCVIDCEKKMAAYIKPSFGIVHSEYLINENTNTICIVESALRGGGVYISSHLVPFATGIDINDILLDKVFGEENVLDSIDLKRNDQAAAYICFYLPPGTINSIQGIEKLETFDFVKLFKLDDLSVGEETHPMLHKGQRKGPIIVTGKNREDLENNIQKVQSTLIIDVVDDSNNHNSIIWD